MTKEDVMNYLTTYRPKSVGVFRDFDRLMDSFFDDVPFWKNGSPKVDIREEDNKYVLEAEIPGFSEKELEIKVEDNLLTLSSKKEEKREEKKEGYLLRERRNASFTRSFVLPKDVDKDKIEAHYKNGLLNLDIPKTPAAKPKVIDVKVK
jgi:HSP20 family protein